LNNYGLPYFSPSHALTSVKTKPCHARQSTRKTFHKILSFRIQPVTHRHNEGNGISLVTTRHFFVAWIFGLRLAVNLGLHRND